MKGRSSPKSRIAPTATSCSRRRGGVEQAKANLENAQLNRDRNEDLFKRGIAARKDLEDARTQVSVQQASLRQVEAQLALGRLQIARTEVHSPLTGTVVKRFVSDGEQVDGTAAQPIAEVANLDRVELYGNVPAAFLGRIHVGETLPVTTEAAPGKSFEGRVVAVSSAVDPATNIGLVRIRLENPGGLLRLGMFLTAQLAVETHANALVVPSQAVYRDEKGQPRVFRLQGDTAEAASVQLGLETNQRVEILSGLREGETIVLTGGYGLADRARVKVQP
ncbi:MAG: efflux RND transporter periplasmic adaptor subunit [Acidobacteriia bacterium]|nr:efflux RND transporter periplasmic adaptor subunit [Terriglobia bacterium]